MAPNSESLPEGTDTIIAGASGSSTDQGGGSNTPPRGTKFEPEKGGSGKGTNGNTSPPAGTSFEPAAPGSGTIKDKVAEKASDLRGQATDKARDLAGQGKEKAVGALDNVVKMVDDAAATIDEKVGEQYGAYARRASETISGLATTLRNKDVDDLARDAADFVRKSPAIAIGAAAAVGFLIARVVKAASAPAGGEPGSETRDTASARKASDVPDEPAV